MDCLDLTMHNYRILLVAVNKEVSGFFTLSRGLRQRDPLSPYLFLIYIEVLMRALQEQQITRKSGVGFKIAPRLEKLSCLLFADDSLPFCHINLKSCQQLGSLLNSFCQKSGQLINFQNHLLLFLKMQVRMTDI